jgi:hypothetical protein
MATQTSTQTQLPNGLAAAALLAGGIGSCALGVTTILNEASPAISNLFKFYGPAGPLSGKTTVAVIIWLVAWAILGFLWKDKEVDFAKVSLWALILLGLGLLGTFPLVFELFAAA